MKGLIQAFKNFQKLFCIDTLSKYIEFSPTLHFYKLQLIFGNMTLLVLFGNPLIIFGDPKKCCRPQFENQCVIQLPKKLINNFYQSLFGQLWTGTFKNESYLRKKIVVLYELIGLRNHHLKS